MEFAKENHVVRDLHFQSSPHGQGKFVHCGRGALFDVATNVRDASPSHGKWLAQLLAEWLR
ncbi:MAG: dTDP-4-dehydrorhamnose 3,5-epimerase family protein [Paracoccaceae bacterium]